MLSTWKMRFLEHSVPINTKTKNIPLSRIFHVDIMIQILLFETKYIREVLKKIKFWLRVKITDFGTLSNKFDLNYKVVKDKKLQPTLYISRLFSK